MLPFKTNLIIILLTIAFISGFAQRLPEGRYHTNRNRQIDLIHLTARLTIDIAQKKVVGTAEVTFSPLKRIDRFTLDAYRLKVRQITLGNQKLTFENTDSTLEISLPSEIGYQDTVTVTIQYSAMPTAGMYFIPDPEEPTSTFVYTYGEGGLHANWLPIYNDVNDLFTTEMIIRVPKGLQVISNGELVSRTVVKKGLTEYHWRQDLPHANYLIAVYAGKFKNIILPKAFDEIPLNVWIPQRVPDEWANIFRNTPEMVEFFSQKFGYRYPWNKYDQVVLPNFIIGAMEHTTVTGLLYSVLRGRNAPINFGPPDFNQYHPVWSAEGTISHELAHHWFGDLVTTENLSIIWLNESFATYSQMLWDEYQQGEDFFALDRITARDRYFDYVNSEHLIRPLEYHYFNAPDEMYNTEHTYFKGALILHMIRKILGDDNFFRTLKYYLNQQAFSNVESHNFKDAIEQVTGENLEWFFDDWVYGAGHPVLEVSSRYFPQRKILHLEIKQIQPLVEGMDYFTLPLPVRIVTKNSEYDKTVWIEGEQQLIDFNVDDEPLMISIDGGGDFLIDLRMESTLRQLLYQVRHDSLAGKIRALRNLVGSYPHKPETGEILKEILSENAFWGLQAEAARLIGKINPTEAPGLLELAFKRPEYQVRKAAIIGLENAPPALAEEFLQKVFQREKQVDVLATALTVYAKINPDLSVKFLKTFLNKPSWYDELTLAALEAMRISGKKEFIPLIKPYVKQASSEHVRMAALDAWASANPDDAKLWKALRDIARNGLPGSREKAIELLGELHVTTAIQLLEKIIETDGNPNIRELARQAVWKLQL